MDVAASRQQLAETLALVERAAATRENVPILSGVLIQADGQTVSLRATDLELTVSGAVVAEVMAPGARVVDARILSSLMRRLGGETVRLRLDGEKTTLTVESGGSRFSLVSSGPEEFPELTAVRDGWRIAVPAARLSQAIEQVHYAAAGSDQRPVLSGVLLEVEKQTLRLVATDGSRLAFRELEVDASEPVGDAGLFTPRVIVPVRSVDEIQRICSASNPSASVSVTLSERLAALEAPAATLVTRLIEGSFPPYRQVFVENPERRFTFPCRPVLEALQRVELLSRRGPAVVRLEARDDGLLMIRSTEADVGQGEEVVEVRLEGAPFEASYQVRFLEDVLKAFGGEEMIMELGSPDRQAMLGVPGDPGFRYIIMPVRLS